MKLQKYTSVAKVDFIGKPSRMGKKVIIIVPSDFHSEFEKVIGKFMKFHGEEILDQK